MATTVLRWRNYPGVTFLLLHMHLSPLSILFVNILSISNSRGVDEWWNQQEIAVPVHVNRRASHIHFFFYQVRRERRTKIHWIKFLGCLGGCFVRPYFFAGVLLPVALEQLEHDLLPTPADSKWPAETRKTGRKLFLCLCTLILEQFSSRRREKNRRTRRSPQVRVNEALACDFSTSDIWSDVYTYNSRKTFVVELTRYCINRSGGYCPPTRIYANPIQASTHTDTLRLLATLPSRDYI